MFYIEKSHIFICVKIVINDKQQNVTYLHG